MERSFSIVMDEDEQREFDEEQLLRKYSKTALGNQKMLESNSEKDNEVDELPPAEPSGRQTVLRAKPLSKNLISSSSDDSDNEDGKNEISIPGEYDPKQYENLDVNGEAKEIFQYIIKYIPQPMNLDHKFKPFIPEFLPAVGDIDAFLKVIPPTVMLTNEPFIANQQLGLVVLDEPAANQSDAALLHLQLRAESVNTTDHNDIVVKKLDNVEKNAKTIDKWIKDISVLHKSKSSPAVRYTEVMPDLDELMQEWPEEIEKQMQDNRFPKPHGSLEEYIEEVCGIFQIPVTNKIHSLHLLFSLYAAVKSSQLFKITAEKTNVEPQVTNTPDQLVLE